MATHKAGLSAGASLRDAISFPRAQAGELGYHSGMLTTTKLTIGQLFTLRHRLEEALYHQHGIRDDGGYAALLVARALGATVNSSGVERGFDLLHPSLGRIEVRSRRLPFDGRNETRAVIPEEKIGHFDWLAHVLFGTDYMLKGAYLVDAADVLANTRPPSRKLKFADGVRLPSAKDITAEVEAVRLTL